MDYEEDFDGLPSDALLVFRGLTYAVLIGQSAFVLLVLAFLLPQAIAVVLLATATVLLGVAAIVGGYGLIRGALLAFRAGSTDD